MLDADRPIESKEQDKLGRAVFAKYLARSIVDHTSPDSLVVGLYGGWGSGKSSIMQMTLEELRYASSNMFDDERPLLVSFSPRNVATQDELASNFFKRLLAEMHATDYFENKNKIIPLLERYISFFTHQSIPEKPWYKKLFSSQREESIQDLTMVKNELNQLLSQQKHKLVIFIDNISRLKNEDILQMFQIVKSIGNFANTIYVLALDKNYVTQVIDMLRAGDGENYLEKLVQLPFDIPPISKQDIESLLLDRLQYILNVVPLESWDRNYWADLYYSTLRLFFKNVRDITRYVNTVNFSYVFVKDVVNPVDFFAITVLEVIEPEVFNGVRENKDLFANLAEYVVQFDKEKLLEDKERCDEILNRRKEMPKEILLRLLVRLFPRLRSIYQTDLVFYHSDAIARKNKRICTYDLFDIYFRFSIANDSFSSHEMYTILSLAQDEKGFALALLRLNQDDRAIKFLDVFDSQVIYLVPDKNLTNVISALMDSGDLFPPGKNTMLRFDTAMRLHRIFQQLLRRYPDGNARYQAMATAIEKSVNSIYTAVHELREQRHQHTEQQDTYIPEKERDFDPEQLENLQKLAVRKIKIWAEQDRLIEHPQLIALLRAWSDWGDSDECRHYVAASIASDKDFMAFLSAALKEPIEEAMAKEEKNSNWANCLKNIEDFVSLEKVTSRAEAIFKDNYFDKLKEPEQLALMIYLDLVKPESVKVIPKTSE